MEFLSQQPMFSTDVSTKGFDLLAGKKWIYPENLPLREYQFSIVQTALFHNTLVGLPTGLGKTFIAAVVMYNFWRWYPTGIIIFLAPTKPLVAQQIDACHDVMGIPISETIELTGTTNQQQRQLAWSKKRVIFATPQTFQKDLEKDIVPMHSIKCVVIDEAHKALGKYAYCESIRMLYESNKYFRVLALSATPGSKINAVQEVIKNLYITHLELRDDTSRDIVPYINKKKFDIITVALGDDLTQFLNRYMAMIDPFYRVLIQHRVLNCPLSNVSKGWMFMVRQEYQRKAKNTHVNGLIQKNLYIVNTMVYAKELLTNHGLRSFYNFYQNHSDKFWLKDVPNFEKLLNDINEYLGPFPDVSSLVDGMVTEVPKDVRFGHGKFCKLKEVLLSHFENAKEKNIDTRAMVFVEFRDSVNEIFVLLLQFQPLIRPQIFVGQSKAGLKQKEQKQALQNFRVNKVNVLISTSVGEEGLDVGEVDLIVCFDNAKHSTTRLIQRMGRTGRKRNGRIIALVSEGKENHELQSVISKRNSFNAKILHSSGVITALNNESPRMVPEEIHPECLKTHMTVIPVTPRGKSKRKVKETKNGANKKGGNRKYPNKNTKDIGNGGKSTATPEQTTKKDKPSWLMNYLQSNPGPSNAQDDEIVAMRIEGRVPLLPQCESKKPNMPKIRPSDVKILSSDNEAVEFLTLYTIKESEKDLVTFQELVNIPYIPDYVEVETDPFTDFEVPSLKVLNCIKSFQSYVPVNGTEDDYLHDHTHENDAIQNDYIQGNNVNDCEPVDLPVCNSGISRTPCAESTEGKFDYLLDSSDSDETLYGPDDTLPSNERIDLTINDDILPEVSASTINDSKEDEWIDLSHSVIENGAFEDLLNTSSDNSNNALSNDEADKKLHSLENKMADEHQSIEIEKSPEKIENTKNPPCMKLNDVFRFWDDTQDNQLSIESSSPHPVNSSRSLLNFFQKTNKDVKTPEKDEEGNTGVGKSPDLTRHSKLQKTVQNRITVSFNNSIDKSTLNVNKSNDKDLTASDDDSFGVESLLADSDFEDQGAAVENINISYNNDKCFDKEGKSNLISDPPVREVENKIENNTLSSKLTEEDLNETFIDDCDWSSDFEMSTTPIKESKYFKSSSTSNNCSPTPNPNVCKSGSTSSTSNQSNSIRVSQKENYPDWILVSKPKSPEDTTMKSKAINNVRKPISLFSKRSVQHDSNSDDDFAPTKIERIESKGMKNNFKNVKRSSDSSKPVNGLLALQKDDSKSLSIRHLSKFAVPKPFAPGPLNSSGLKSPWKRSTSLDECKKRRRVRKTSEIVKRKHNFIDDEAEVSSDGDYSLGSSGDDDDDDDDDEDLGDFVSHTQYHDQSIDMRAHYLQSLKSPRIPGRFLIKQPKTLPRNVDIYSQTIPVDDNSYLQDSFCVDNEEIHDQISSDEITILEVADKKLSQKKRKRSNSCSFDGSRSKRKRIVQVCDDSSEDETEQMRAQIAEESMILRKL